MKTKYVLISLATISIVALIACGPNSDSNLDGINARDTSESISRDDYGRDESLRYENVSDSERIRKASENKHEQGNTKGDDGTIEHKK